MLENKLNKQEETVPEDVHEVMTASTEVDVKSKSKTKRGMAFFKRHGLEIVLGAGCLALCVVNAYQGDALSEKDKLLALKDGRIRNLVELCEEKDDWFKALASDALKHGSSFGAKCMVDRREYLNGK